MSFDPKARENDVVETYDGSSLSHAAETGQAATDK